MIPGKTYIGRLPGRTRKTFVRKRPTAIPPILVVDKTVNLSLPVYSSGAPAKMGMFSRARRDGYYVSYGPNTSGARYKCTRVPDMIYTTAPPPSGRTATSVRQTCAACGRFRSARWEATHPLSPGMAASSSICARCQHDRTSSEEREPKTRRRKQPYHHRHSRRCTDRTDESYCSLKDRRSPRRYRSDSRDYPRPKPSSRDNIRIVIANQPGERPRPRPRRSSSFEGVRVSRQTSFVEVPERIRSRSRTGSSSRAYYLDNGTAQYAEDLARPRYRSRSRSLSRASYVEELAPPVSGHRRRSSSRVQFVDEYDEPGPLPRPRRISRRRAVYFDGPASLETAESHERGRSRSVSSVHKAERSTPSVELVAETIIPPYRPMSQIKNAPSDDQSVEEKPSSHQYLDSKSTTAVSDPYVHQHDVPENARAAGSEHGRHRQYRSSAACDTLSEQDNAPSLAPRSTSASQVSGRVRKLSSHKRTYSRSADSGYQNRNKTSMDGSVTPASKRRSDDPATPQNKRRRRYRDDSTEDEHRPVTPLTFRHLRAPSSTDPHNQADYLSEMLKSSHITPPSEQTNVTSHYRYACGPPSPPRSRSASPSENSAYRPPFYHDTTTRGTEYGCASYQYSPVEDVYGDNGVSYASAPVEDLYGNKIGGYGYVPGEGQYEGDSAAAAEYDWM